jgi:RimJ/RimL family protein N-acetyltransferase
MKHYPHPFDAEETRHWIRKNLDRYIKDSFGMWAVELKENGQLIGDCGITMQNIHGNLEPEVGYHINKKYQKQGYATEAAAACIKYAFDELNFTRVFSYMKYTNEASARVAMKNGMQFIEEYEDPINIITKVYAITSK